MDDRRIARALAGTEEADAAERARRRRARWRVVFRITAVVCLLAAAALAAMLLRPLPRQAELQFTQGTISQAGWEGGAGAGGTRGAAGGRGARFTITLDDQSRVFVIDPTMAERSGRALGDIARPGVTARVGYTAAKPLLGGPWRAWDFAVNGRTVYSLGDIRSRAARDEPPYWFLTSALLAAGVILWFVTPRPRRSRHRRRAAAPAKT